MALETLVLPPPEPPCHSDNDWSILHAILRFFIRRLFYHIFSKIYSLVWIV